jgi:tRNA-specific 2-thiouridylase
MAKVFVGLSGGVDSSVTAALLKERGYDVAGVFMKNWTRDIGGVACPWRADLADAKRVAVQLDIPFEVFDFQKQYKQKVVDYMLAEYQAGRTPNPDVMCNQEVKFRLFLDTAKEHGAEKIATGHYARVKNGKLYAGVDKDKDQSYFLYRVTEEALKQSLMPIGELKKTEVRRLAKKFGLVTADKPDSQGICFVGEVGITDFIGEFVKLKPGLIIDTKTEKVLGQHQGALLYTVGQRHGLGLGGGLPYYVTKTDVKKNIVYVSTQLDDDNFWREEVDLSSTHWINEAPAPNKTYRARLRYRGELLPATVKTKGKTAEVMLKRPERAVAAGQSVVVYDGEQVLGGGIVN